MGRQDRDRALFDGIAARYAAKDLAPASATVRRAQVADAVAPLLGGLPWPLVVELGCGAGAPAAALSGRYDRYVGIDQSVAMLRAARVLNRDQHAAVFAAADITRPPLRASADLLLLVGVLHHVEAIEVALQAMLGLVRPGGWVVAIEPSGGNPAIQLARAVRARIDRDYSEEQVFFRRPELARLFSDAGFVDVEVRHHGYLAKPLGQVVLPGGRPLAAIARALVGLDRMLARRLPAPLARLSWDLIVRARRPEV